MPRVVPLAVACGLLVGCGRAPLRELDDVRLEPGETHDGERHLTLRARLPFLPGDADDLVLEVPPVVETWEARVDDEVVARWERPTGTAGVPGVATVLVPLRRSQLGRPLTLSIASRHLHIGPMAPLHLGARSDVVGAIVARDLGPLAVAGLLAIAGLLVLSTLIAAERERRPRVALGVTLLSLSAYVANYTQVRDLVVHAPRAFTIAWGLGIPWAAWGVVVLTRELVALPPEGRSARALGRSERALVVVAGLYTLVAVGGQLLLSVLPASVARPYYAILIPLDVTVRLAVAATVAVVVPAVATVARRDRSALFVLLGVGALGTSTAIDVGLYAAGAKHRWTSDVAWGALGLGVALVASFGARFAALNRAVEAHAADLQRRSQERDALVHELHDGLGSLVTNIRMLVGVGERVPDTSQYGAIGGLAEEALYELRAFTHATREEASTWDATVADLRHATSTLVSPHGRPFEVDARVLPDAPLPTSVTLLHVSRVAREAVMNAVKHTPAGRIDVRLVVDAQRLTLEVEDGGKGSEMNTDGDAEVAAPGWLSGGVGMESMRARAQALRGTLTIEKTRGTLVRLEVPWT
ncbi:MAG: hypothetical protein KC668_01165 [Myxococcales bacterium]|nr:hypothetical protein [Myxococcales bacterium]